MSPYLIAALIIVVGYVVVVPLAAIVHDDWRHAPEEPDLSPEAQLEAEFVREVEQALALTRPLTGMSFGRPEPYSYHGAGFARLIDAIRQHEPDDALDDDAWTGSLAAAEVERRAGDAWDVSTETADLWPVVTPDEIRWSR
jgi:hypothetical protein